MNKSVIISLLKSIKSPGIPNEGELSKYIKDKELEKFDEFLCEDLLNMSYGKRMFDIDGGVILPTQPNQL